jgi:hypothetical protein
MSRIPSTTPLQFPLTISHWIGFVVFIIACTRPEPADKFSSGIVTRSTSDVPVRQFMSKPSLPSTLSPKKGTDSELSDESGIAQLRSILSRARSGGKGSVTYVEPTTIEFDQYKNYVSAALSSDNFSSKPVLSGFTTESVHPNFDVLEERLENKRGSGIIVLRKKSELARTVQVPHSFFDEGTLNIGLVLFLNGNSRLLQVNTAHRYRTNLDLSPRQTIVNSDSLDQSADSKRPISSDVAHFSNTFFLAAHHAFVDSSPDTITIQIHGFANSSAPNTDIVVSAAKTRTQLQQLVIRLRNELSLNAKLYPTDIRKLGGTTNIEAKYCAAKNACFAHLELSQSLRDRLNADTELLNRFARITLSEVHCP